MTLKYSVRNRMLHSGIIAGAIVLALAACVPAPASSSSPAPSSSDSASTAATASASPSASASPARTTAPSHGPTQPGTVVTLRCSALVSAQAVYDFNPNFSLQESFTPSNGSPAAIAVSDNGIACRWINQTSSDTFTFSLAHPAASSLATLKKSASAGTALSGYGDSAFFSTTGGVGRVDVFSGVYWMTATSVYFATANDASGLLRSALGALR